MDQSAAETLRRFVRQNLRTDTDRLLFSAKKYPDIPLKKAVEQILALRKIEKKLPRFFSETAFSVPNRQAAEQCSSEFTARYKSALFSGNYFLDLSGGLGIDAFHFAEQFSGGLFLEPQKELAETAKYNTKILGISNLKIENKTAEQFLEQAGPEYRFDLIYADPSRRDPENRRLCDLSDCNPDIPDLLPKLFVFSDLILIKASPMIDLSEAGKQLPGLSEIRVAAVRNECKEVLFTVRKGFEGEPEIYAVDLRADGRESEFFFTKTEEKTAVPEIGEPENYLYEPGSAVLKAGPFKLISERLGVRKLHRETHFYTADRLLPDFPGRAFRFLEELKFRKKEVKKALPGGRAEVISRNFPESAAEISRKFGLRSGGNRYLLCLSLAGGKKSVLLCERLY